MGIFGRIKDILTSEINSSRSSFNQSSFDKASFDEDFSLEDFDKELKSEPSKRPFDPSTRAKNTNRDEEIIWPDTLKEELVLLEANVRTEFFQIKKNYIVLLKRYHPDTNSGSMTDDKSKQINAAYEKLEEYYIKIIKPKENGRK
ncbi:MAG: hypothetical protein Kapaf2KO_01700 [Candidatus Kapaibacteriales bacterium]